MLLTILTVITLAITVAYIILKWKYNYWKRRNVPHTKPSLILGNYGDYLLMKMSMGEASQKICQQFPNEPYVGAYYGTEPALVIQDPDLIKLITTKDFYFFNSREVAEHTTKETSTQSLFFTHGETWKVVRQSMTPLFTPVKMKNMFPLVKKCSQDFEKMLDREIGKSSEVDAISIMARFTMDCIGTTAFGVETKTLEKAEEGNPFTKIGDLLFEVSYTRVYSFIFRAIWPSVFYGLGFKVFPQKMNDFFFKLITGVFTDRNYKPTNRNDFIDLILKLKEKDYITCDNWSQVQTNKTIQLKVGDELLVSQCQVIFAAGYETSATTVSYTLYELAKNQKAQKRALEEVDAYIQKRGLELEYEHLSELPYLDACIDEAMRLYPVLGTLSREVVQDYMLPSGLVLEKGLRIHLPMWHMHRHPDFFPEPEKFCPERFLPERKHEIVPYTYMPFGEGNRICIGLRFGKILTMTGLLTLLKKYRVELPADMPWTPRQDPRAFVTRPISGIRVRLIPRN